MCVKGEREKGGFIVGGRNVAESLRRRSETDGQTGRLFLRKAASLLFHPLLFLPSKPKRTDCFLATDGAQIRGHNSSLKERGDISLPLNAAEAVGSIDSRSGRLCKLTLQY